MQAHKGKELMSLYNKQPGHPLRLSLRYKVAMPVLLLVSLMIFILSQTTFVTVRSLMLEHNRDRLEAIAEGFAETVKVPLILKNQQVLLANVEWMAKRPDVVEVRVEDSEGSIVGGGPSEVGTQKNPVDKNFLGVLRLDQDNSLVAAPIRAHDRQLGRVIILFRQQGFETQLHDIFQKRLLLALIMALGLALLTTGVAWLAIRPLSTLKRATQRILAGDMTARAQVVSFDEIQDLGDAFNEMVSRLARSLDNLRARTEALEESEEKYRLIVENSSDIIFTLTPEGEIVLLNKDISGYTRDELFHEGLELLLKLHTPESRIKFEEALSKLSAEKIVATNLAVTHIHPESKREINYLANLTPMIDHEGNVKMIQVVMRDVTELRRLELMKESLIRDVAHELKTPTAKFEMAVEWFEKELQKHKEIEKYKPVIQILKSNTDRLMRTIMSIMDLSRLESGMSPAKLDPIDLREVLDQVRTDMESICKQKGLTLDCHFEGKHFPMSGDKDMLYRLFVNLIGNAVKFTEKGKISFSCHMNSDKILVAVSDSGMGLDPADLERVFERFFQKTASSMGIGVGLTISRDIAVMHHARIWAESEGLGKGTSFKVEFPSI